MKLQRTLMTLILTFVLLAGNVSTVFAMPPLPSGFYGTVKIGGANVPGGTVVSARINGVQYAYATVQTYNGDTVYALDVPGDDPESLGTIEGGVQGQTVVFYVGSEVAQQTGTWQTGTSIEFNLTVAVNSPPTINEGSSTNVTMSEDGSPSAFSLTLHASDVDADTLTWSISSAAAHGTASASGTGTTKSIGYTPQANYNGPDIFVVQVSDGKGGTDTITVNVTINAVNDTPTASSIANVSVSENAPDTTIDLWPSFADVEDADSALTYSVFSNSNPALFTSTNISSGRYLVLNYAAGMSGTASITVRATDSGGLFAQNTFTVTVSNLNDPPAITEGASTAVTMSEDGSPTAFSLTLHATDPDGDTLTWSISDPAGHGTASASGTGLSKAIGFTPTANYSGPDSFVVQVSDGNGGTDTITVNVTINPVNDLPTLNAISSPTINEDAGPQNVSLGGIGAGGGESQSLQVSASSDNTALIPNPAVTYTSPAATGSLSYSPVANQFGSADITVTVTDPGLDGSFGTTGDNGVSQRTFTITVNPVNDAPSFSKGADQNVAEDAGPQTVSGWATSLSAGPPNEAGQTLTFNVTANSNPGLFSSGPAVSGSTGALTYTPAANASGSATITLTLSDNGGTANGGVNTSASQSFVITVTGANDPPAITEGASVSVTMSEDGSPTAFNLTLHATDPDGDTLTWSISSPAAQGAATASGSGASKVIGYAPTANYSGADSFAVQVSDGNGGLDTITVNVTVSAVNDVPTTGGIPNVVVAKNAPNTTIDLWASFADIEDADGSLTYAVVANTNPALFTSATIVSGRNLVLDYAPGISGSSNITVRATDSGGLSVQTLFNVSMDSNNTPPVITEGASVAVTMSENGTPTPFSLTLHATDVDGDTLTWSISTAALHGTATASGTGLSKVIAYTPTANYNGTDTFIVQVSDGSGGLDTINVNVTIQAVNNAPVITEGASVAVTMSEDSSPTVFSLTLHATDIDSATLTWSISSAAAHGTATASGTGLSKVIGYVPAANYNGTDTFTVRVTDGVAADTIVVNVTLNPVNDPPVALSQSVATGENTPRAINLGSSDVDGDPLSYWIVTNPLHGTLSGTAPNLSYLPSTNFNGSDDFSFRVNDGYVYSNLATISITVSSANNAPTNISLSSTSIKENMPAGSVVAILTTTDPDAGDTFTYSLVSDAAACPSAVNNASFSVSDNNLLSAAAFDYEVKSSYKICLRSTDSAGLSFTKPFTITIADTLDLSTFVDVPVTHMFWQYIEALYDAGITSGCLNSPMSYCPDGPVTRGQMAVFIERAMGNFAPSPSPSGMFSDVPPGHQFKLFIEELYNDKITQGCSLWPLSYCPDLPVTRGQMAVFIERGMGNFSPNPSPSGMFADVPPGHEFKLFIEELYNDGITAGCLTSPLSYCPDLPVTRGQMAVFIVRAFGIPLP